MRKITYNPQFFYNPKAHNAYYYARGVIKGRWEEAEPYITKAPYYALLYARDILKSRWYEAEFYIIKFHNIASWYKKIFLQDRTICKELSKQ